MIRVVARTFALILAPLLPVGSAPAQAPAKTVSTRPTSTRTAYSPSVPQIKFEKYKLKNGLDVILAPDHRLPMVAVNLWYHVGPANERPGRTGFAHLFEHMMFEGSKHTGENPFHYLEAAGASEINGTTGFDRTNYFETLPSNQLELALWLESDRMGYLLDGLNHQRLANQRDVVRNERRQSLENTPYGLVEEAVFHELFPKQHPYYASVIGSHADIEAARLADVREFLRQYYVPNNASLAIVGHFDPANTKSLVEKYFDSIPPGPLVPKIQIKTPAITSERRVTVTDQIELPRVYMAWITSPIFTPGDAEMDIAAQVLGGGKSSRLYKKLVYEKQIAQDVSVENQSLMLGSVVTLKATAKPGVKPEDLERVINDELDRFRKDGPSEPELERARNTIETQIISRLETLGGFGGVADRLNSYNHYLGDPGYLPRDLQRYDNATVASVKKVAAEQLQSNERVVVYGVPGKKVIEDVPKTAPDEEAAEGRMSAESRMADEMWRARPPQPGPTPSFELPVPATFKLLNGLSVYVVERHNLPIVAAGVTVLSGSGANPADKPGLASFVADMLDEGTNKRSALLLADDTAQIGATLKTDATMDASYVTIQVLKKNADAAFDLLSDVTLDPAFDNKEIERIRTQRITRILQERDDPRMLARRGLARVLYGKGHPYGFPDDGTAASNRALTRQDLTKFWKSGYTPANSALVVAGDLSQAELRPLVEKYFGKWNGGTGRVQPPNLNGSPTRSTVIIDKPGAPQTAVLVGTVAAARSTPDYVGMEVMNTALGGSFSSRINMNLREKHGYTYGASSRFTFHRQPGPFTIRSSVRTDVTGPAVSELFKEIEEIRQSKITPEELQLAKGAFALALPGRFETARKTVNSISELFVYDLPNDYYRGLPARINGVTAADVQAMAKKYLIPENILVVAAGDRAKIEPELKKLSLGNIEVRDYEANPVLATAATPQ